MWIDLKLYLNYKQVRVFIATQFIEKEIVSILCENLKLLLRDQKYTCYWKDNSKISLDGLEKTSFGLVYSVNPKKKKLKLIIGKEDHHWFDYVSNQW